MKWEIEAFVVTNIEESDLKDSDRIISINKAQIEECDGIVVALGKKMCQR